MKTKLISKTERRELQCPACGARLVGYFYESGCCSFSEGMAEQYSGAFKCSSCFSLFDIIKK